MLKKVFLFPLAALTALSGAAFAKAPSETPKIPQEDVGAALASVQLNDAVNKALAIYRQGNDAFAFTLDQDASGTLIAGHRSHVSEPPRDCRRLQLLRRWSHHEQDHEQVFP